MDKATEQIALNFFEAISQLEEGRNLQKNFRESAVAFTTEIGDGIDEAVAKAEDNYELAKELFWQAFKYPLQIFDLKKGEKPDIGEYIYVYDEYDGIFERAEYAESSSQKYFRQSLHILELSRYHRWTRLPILEPEK